MLRYKIETRVDRERKWPYTPYELIEMLDRGPLKEIYNVSCASINPAYKVNEYGYAITRSRPVSYKNLVTGFRLGVSFDERENG